jgi:hypothetical protein
MANPVLTYCWLAASALHASSKQTPTIKALCCRQLPRLPSIPGQAAAVARLPAQLRPGHQLLATGAGIHGMNF